MATGIRIINDFGTTQIDESYFNLVLLSKVSYSVSVPTSPTSVTHTVSSPLALIALQVWPHTFTVSGSQLSSGVWTFRVSFYNNPSTSDPCNYTVYSFGLPPTPSETTGLKVSNASGGLIFHSEFKPLRILSVMASTSGYTAPSGRSIACLQFEPSIYSTLLGADGNLLRCDGAQISPLFGGIQGGATVGTSRAGIHAAVDVTNY